MPDMKTALETALKTTINEWADDDKPTTQTTNQKEKATMTSNANYPVNFAHVAPGKVRFTPTVGVTEAVFNYVKNNPGKTRREIIDALSAQGFKASSITSLVGQFTRVDYFSKDANGGLRVAFNDFKPLPSTAKQIRYFKAKQAALKKPAPKTLKLVTKKPKASKAEGIAALKVDTGAKALPLPLPVNTFEPGALIDNLSVMQARELYDTLKRIFGG